LEILGLASTLSRSSLIRSLIVMIYLIRQASGMQSTP
jgi:hypothetical protein